MLERLSKDRLNVLYRISGGTPIRAVQVRNLLAGQVIRIKTASNNIYLLEVRDPRQCSAEVCRKERRGEAQSGYRGLRAISPVIMVGSPVRHGQQTTNPVVEIEILSKVA